MSRALFLSRLKEGLSGMPGPEQAEIMADYESYFAEGAAKGRSESDVEAALGDPARLAKELRAEASLKSWEEHRSPGNFLRATLALMGLATLDFFILIPAGCIFLIVNGAMTLGFAILGIAGFASAIGAMAGGHGGLSGVFAGLGMISLAIGMGALILKLMGWAMRLAGRYVRLHYRLLETPTV